MRHLRRDYTQDIWYDPLVSSDVSSSHVDSEYHEPKISFYFPLDGDSTQQFVSKFCIFLPFHLKSL